MTLTFIGHGYVGLVTAAVFADFGNTVWVIGHTKDKIENLKKGIIPIYEPGLEEVVKRNLGEKRLLFTLDYDEAMPASDIIFIAVGTPSKPNGDADLSTVFEVSKEIGKHLDGYSVIATKSTVPIGTNKKIKEIIEAEKPKKAEFDIASVPEFLREGSAIKDTRKPDRIVIGVESRKARDLLVLLHNTINAPVLLTKIESAEMIKYASNAFLSTKISFANAIARLCELSGADAQEVLDGVGFDKRIGRAFLYPGVGFGGSCFPKDVRALISISKSFGYDFNLLSAVEGINSDMRLHFVKKAKKLLGGSVKGKIVGVLGLAFKPDTDDMREAPSIDIINALVKEGAKIKAYDPVAMENAKTILPEIILCDNPYKVAENADILLIVTEWKEFRGLDLDKIKSIMKSSIILDGRNMYNPKILLKKGFIYQGVGRA